MVWIPIVLFLVVGLFLYLIIVGHVSGEILLRSKVRSTPAAVFAGTVIGAFAVYVAWVSWIYAMSNLEFLAFAPSEILSVAEALATEGVWEFEGFKPTGSGLYFFWVLEALAIVGAATYGSYSTVADIPFCEACQNWVKSGEVIGVFEGSPHAQDVREGLEQERVEVLSKLVPTKDRDRSFMLARAECCEKCSGFSLLSLKGVTIEVGSDGYERSQEQVIFRRLIVNGKVIDAVKTAADIRRLGASDVPGE